MHPYLFWHITPNFFTNRTVSYFYSMLIILDHIWQNKQINLWKKWPSVVLGYHSPVQCSKLQFFKLFLLTTHFVTAMHFDTDGSTGKGLKTLSKQVHERSVWVSFVDRIPNIHSHLCGVSRSRHECQASS